MAKVVCPDCGKEVDPSEGFCVFCGYTFDDGQAKSPFAAAANAQMQSGGFEETSSGSPVIRFDSSNMDYVPASSMKGSSELMFGIGLCRILAIFFAAVVILAMVVPFVTVRIAFPKSSIPAGADMTSLVRTANQRDFDYKDDGTKITISKSASLITSPNHYMILMIAACITGIVFAVRGKPAGYLVCGIGGGLLGLVNYLLNFASIDAVMRGTNFARLSKAMSKIGMTFNVDKGVGAYLLLIGGVGMIVSAIIFLNNHAAYDN